MRLACNTVLFATSDLDTALQHIAWAGFDGAELAAIPGMVEHLDTNGDQTHVHTILDVAGRYGLRLPAIEATGNLLDAEAFAKLERAMEKASELSIPVVNIGSSGVASDDASFARVVDRIGALAELASPLGVTLGVKAHVGAALWNGPTLLRALAIIRHPAFGVNFDPSHLYRGGEYPVKTARQLAGHVVACHIRDNRGRAQRVSPPDQQVPGNGDMDLRGIVLALHEGGFSGSLTFECIGAGGYPLSSQSALAAEAHEYLHRLLQEADLDEE